MEPECGRKVLKVTDHHNRIFVGGKTLKQDGTVTADYFDAQNFGQVSVFIVFVYFRVDPDCEFLSRFLLKYWTSREKRKG